MERVAVVGLGLIGGSLARELASHDVRVVGRDIDAATTRAALDAGILHTAIDPRLEDCGAVDAVILAVPVDAAIDLLGHARDALLNVPLVMDACSTKRSIMEAARRMGLADRFVGAHPLAGDHRAGWNAARTGLFEGATVYVCDDAASAGAAQRAHAFWRMTGAMPESIDAAVHDALLARTSHLPQAASTALARAILRSGIALDRLGPGGRDTTRLAHSSSSLWASIALDNADLLAPALRDLEREVAELRTALESGDRNGVLRFFDVFAS